MRLLMEETKKFILTDVEEAEEYVQEVKESVEKEGAQVIDYKITVKETKDSEYVILSVKVRYLTLAEAKERVGL